ncbi:hypothetical protein BE17_29255 [Sorangium cellulosum]|uniref:AAA+ ATPase domain-containing protein n=1 Tax=Sorangium cellulosum TaxID=56 RepID=A0A150RQD3_SORCE|nr:hypothetical protein BE17_29255 [Sorangium cellulosum]
MPGHPLHESLVARRSLAFQRWFSLVEAVMLIHDESMMHRSLTPLATCALLLPDAPVLVDGFQMSAFVSTWLRGAREEDTVLHLADLDGDHLACMPPERVGPLLGQRRRFIESFRTDVFSLGVIGASWLTRAPVGWARGLDARTYTESRHREAVSVLRDLLARAALPRPLKSLLENMMAFEPGSRIPSGRMAYDEAAKLYGLAFRELEAPTDSGASAHKVHYLKETMDRLYEDQRTRTHPSAPDYIEYDEAIERDLEDATMTWSTTGFDPWTPKQKDGKTRLARIVLLGREYAYFCQFLDQGIGVVDKRAIVIKYVIHIHRARTLRLQPKVRAVPRVQAKFLEAGRAPRMTRAVQSGAPSWDDLVSSIEFADVQGPAAPLVRAGTWLLGAQRAREAAQEYRYNRLDSQPEAILLREHTDPDLPPPDTEEGAFLALHLGVRPRQPMGRCFESEWRDGNDTGDVPKFLLRTGWHGRDEKIRLAFSERPDDHTVRFESRQDGALVPSVGYVRPDDGASRVVQGRQRAALRDLEQKHHHLAAQITNPTALELKLDSPPSCPGLEDGTRTLVQRILETWPLFVLQGPPGTGKTFVAQHTVEAVLSTDPFARLLVSAQSHHALNNLLEGIVGQAQTSVTPHNQRIFLRIASKQTQSKVVGVAEQYLPEKIVSRIVSDLQKYRPDGRKKTALDALAHDWKRLAVQNLLQADLEQRLVRSASVVFVTCSGAGSQAVRSTRGAMTYDWVIIEEAGRGWFTELLVPMVQGTRWLLIGDHAQLPAFQAREIETLLDKDVESGITAVATGAAPDASWRKFFRHFESLMSAPEHRGVSAHETLTTQRRMHPDIAGLVSSGYYGDLLETHPEARRSHELRNPGFLQRTALVWLDTTSLRLEASERGERDGLTNLVEVNAVRRLLSHIASQLREHNPAIPPIVLLSPYRGQVKLLRERVQEVPAEAVHTVDSVQGRQAEVVIVSLVRNNAESGEREGIGFLAEPERANVMFSRARRLLVIVGSLSHFERFSETHWCKVSAYIRSEPRFLVDAAKALDLQGRR